MYTHSNSRYRYRYIDIDVAMGLASVPLPEELATLGNQAHKKATKNRKATYIIRIIPKYIYKEHDRGRMI